MSLSIEKKIYLGLAKPGSGGGGQPEKYAMFSRVKDDNNVDIGCVVGYYSYNNVKYAVVCLNSSYRDNSTYQFLSDNVATPGVPTSTNYVTSVLSDTLPNATFYCDKILDMSDYTSAAVLRARQAYFTINGTVYYGQIPNMLELYMITGLKAIILDSDPTYIEGSTVGIYPNVWSSTQAKPDGTGICAIQNTLSSIMYSSKTDSKRVIPILEIPIN